MPPLGGLLIFVIFFVGQGYYWFYNYDLLNTHNVKFVYPIASISVFCLCIFSFEYISYKIVPKLYENKLFRMFQVALSMFVGCYVPTTISEINSSKAKEILCSVRPLRINMVNQ